MGSIQQWEVIKRANFLKIIGIGTFQTLKKENEERESLHLLIQNILKERTIYSK